ncbi:MAG: glycosyltransferase family 4 protein [Parcubacteria group bacterium]|jgi:glycosyltransferase involved in cell wall biosynthesis
MKILWFTWKDLKNPYAGGAEVVNEQLAKRLAADGHEVLFLVRGFAGGKQEEMVDGYKIVRLGNYHTVYWEAYRYYQKNLRGWADLVIEEVNTIPFFCNFYVQEKSVLFFHQLCREIWFYEMGFWKGLVGYVAEFFYLWLLGHREVITVSASTKKDLQWCGFRQQKIHIISEGLEMAPLADLSAVEKFPQPTLLSLGALRPMKRTDHIVRAFELAKAHLPALQLIVAGDTTGSFGNRIKTLIAASPYRDSIQLLGRVTPERRNELMQKSHLLCAAAVREGWGLIVTEANSQGTPAVVFDIHGLRDSVRNNVTGLICEKNTPEGMSAKIQEALQNQAEYGKMRLAAWQWSQEITFDRSYQDFKNVLSKLQD